VNIADLIDPGDFTPEALAKIAPACLECGRAASIVSGAVIYPHRPDLAGKWVWSCQCGARCGVHPGTFKPLGRPGNDETRAARAAAHAAFDPLWRKRMRLSNLKTNKARSRGYVWLAGELGIDAKECHIANMDAATARRVVEICRRGRN
jgi:hypothetical protein